MALLAQYITLAELKAMERICLIIDMEGFLFPNFVCSELKYADRGGCYGDVMYSLPMKYTDLLPNQVKQVTYVRRCIHGLPHKPTHFENAKPQEELPVDVVDLYRASKTELTRQKQKRSWPSGVAISRKTCW